MTLMLVDDGRIALDDPIKQWIPGFGATRVLRPEATSLDDTEALARDIPAPFAHPYGGPQPRPL
jgi:CubicO group peptidase (beta-lactamase class C family)